MDDFDFEDWWSGGSFVESGIPVSIPDISVSNFDIGSLDLSGIFDPTDISGLTNLDLSGIFDPTDIGGLTSLDLSGMFDPTDISGLTNLDLSGVIDPTDISGLTNLDLSGVTDPTDISGLNILDLSTVVDPTDVSDLNLLKTYDGPEQTESEIRSQLGDKTYEELYGPYAGLGYSEKDIEQLKEGTYAGREQTPAQVKEQLGEDLYNELYPMGVENLSSSVYEGLGYTAKDIADLMSNQTPIRPTDWSGVIKTDKTGNITQIGDKKVGEEVIKPTPPKTEPTKTTTPDDKKSIIDRIFGTTGKDSALLMALLGGLLGLLGKGSAPKLPVGYQGGIPKYTATRVPGRGVQYTRAAGGGLMDLAGGGRPARYLRGGTDGMADEIKTDIDGKQPARLSHGEFVIPADVVSHLGNGNSDAGADVLYDMMAKVRKARTGTTKQGKQINPRKMIPA